MFDGVEMETRNTVLEGAVAEALVVETLPGLETPPVVADTKAPAEVFDDNPKENPADMLLVTQYMEAKILATLTEIESKGQVIFQTERDVTRTIQSNLFECALQACSRLTDQRTILDLFTRACNSSEFKWKELHGIDPKANLKLIDERTHTPVKLVSKYNYWKSVTRFGLGAPRRGETALRQMFPVAHKGEDGAAVPASFDAWFSAVAVAYEKFRETESAHNRATGNKPRKDQEQKKIEAPADDNVPFIPGFNGAATRKALVKVSADEAVIRALNELVRLSGEALDVGVEPNLIAELVGDISDMLRKEIQAKLEK